ncbi:M24 family metallopeptidase [Massilia sp. H-1]|nr:M24 family metallopeptidase [Massilia sp. H-1]
MRRLARSGVTAQATVHDLHGMLDEMRVFKDDTEVALMQRAATISAQAHERDARLAARHVRVRDRSRTAARISPQRRPGARLHADRGRMAANACVLHYNVNNAQSRDGDLILIDAGCRILTATPPTSPALTPSTAASSEPQKVLYELVLAAQEAALAVIRPGTIYTDMHDAAVRVLAQGMLDLGLLDKEKFASVDEVIAERAHQQFYMHGTGHWLGLDVHDAGAYRATEAEGKPSRPLQA